MKGVEAYSAAPKCMKIINALRKPNLILLFFLREYSKLIKNDSAYSKLEYFLSTGKFLNLKNPKTFNEKLQWLKLKYYIKREYSIYVDKLLVKEVVSRKIGEQYIIRTLGIWNDFDDIDFKKLPNQFVLKCTHNSGGLIICKNKTELNIEKTRRIIVNSLKTNYFMLHRECPYKYVSPKIIAEELLIDKENQSPKDYKIFCMNGKPKFLYVASDRPHDTKFDFFDIDFNHLPFKQVHPHSSETITKPKNFDLMLKIASELSIEFPQVRIDLYNINGNIYFGEFTFIHMAGIFPFHPKKWDEIIGNWLDISSL